VESRNLPQSQREIALRRAISTIYYGVFWKLRERLLRVSFPEAYPLMEELKRLREMADYQKDWKPDLKKFRRVKNLAN